MVLAHAELNRVGPAGVSGPGGAPSAPRPLRPDALSHRRAEILDGLEGIVLQEGFRGLRLTEVARRLSTSNTTLYQLGSTKDELLMVVVDRWYQKTGARAWRSMAAADDPKERLRLWLLRRVEGFAHATKAFLDDVASHAGLAQLAASYRRYYVLIIERLIHEGIPAGAFRSVDARMAALVFDAAAARLHDPRDPATQDAETRRHRGSELVDLLFNGIVRAN